MANKRKTTADRSDASVCRTKTDELAEDRTGIENSEALTSGLHRPMSTPLHDRPHGEAEEAPPGPGVFPNNVTPPVYDE